MGEVRAPKWLGWLISVGIAFSLILLTETFLRNWIQLLPEPVMVYLHKDLKESVPQVWEYIRAFNPWVRGRREDHDVGWTFVPGDERSGKNEDGEPYERRTSQLGFFTPDEPREDADQVVVIGDSFLSTFYATEPVPWVIRNQLNIPVYTLAVGGWGPENYRRAFIKYAQTRNSKVVAVFTFNNDITDVDNWLQWQRSGKDKSFLSWIWENNPDGRDVNNGNSWLDRDSILWNWLKFAVQRGILATRASFRGSGSAVEHSEIEKFPGLDKSNFVAMRLTQGYQFAVLDPAAFAPGGSYWPYMDEYFRSLLRLRDTIRSAGKEMLLIWVPAKERVYLPLLPKNRYLRYVKNQTGRIDGLERALQTFADETGTKYLDVTPEFLRRARNGEKLYFTSDGHLNSHGNRVLGALAANAISTARTVTASSNPS